MFEKLSELIRNNETQGDFTYAKVTDEVFEEGEKKLGISIPNEYKWFIKHFGHGGIGGIEVLGVGKNGKSIFVDTTLKYRNYGLPNNLLVIENCDEWLYCMDSQNGKIVMWSQGSEECEIAYNDFEDYLTDRINDMLENM